MLTPVGEVESGRDIFCFVFKQASGGGQRRREGEQGRREPATDPRHLAGTGRGRMNGEFALDLLPRWRGGRRRGGRHGSVGLCERAGAWVGWCCRWEGMKAQDEVVEEGRGRRSHPPPFAPGRALHPLPTSTMHPRSLARPSSTLVVRRLLTLLLR